MSNPPQDNSLDMLPQERDAAIEDYMASLFLGAEEQFDITENTNAPPRQDLCFKDEDPLAAPNALPSLAPIEPRFKTSITQSHAVLPEVKRKVMVARSSARISAEAVPCDVTLTQHQKQNLQKLFDEKLFDEKLLTAPLGDLSRAIESNPLSVSDVSTAQHLASHLEEAVCIDLNNLNNSTAQLPLVMDSRLTLEAELNTATIENNSVDSDLDFSLNLTPNANFRAHWVNQLPNWGQARFDVLLFQSRGVTLAIPLMSLGHIYLQSTRLNQLPNAPSWVLGIKPLPNLSLNVIDAGEFFMPQRANLLNIEEHYNILALADSQWSFAVDSVTNPISVVDTDVQWRTLSNTHPWIAGTIKQHMCVLIDGPALLKMMPL